MLKQDSIQKLKKTKNLLAFSAGVDSSALFFMLHDGGVEFDIAIVDYNIRKSSKDEVAHAKDLANEFNKKIYTKSVKLPLDNFEHRARDARYEFFDELISEHDYNCIITAHQLNDKVEWLLMAFCRGSGIVSMSGMGEFEERDKYALARPMLDVSRDEIVEYLELRNIKYFEDESNSDEKYQRNYFRKNHSNELVKRYKSGIKKSFEILSTEKNSLYPDARILEHAELLVSKPKNKNELLFLLDRSLKKLGYSLTGEQRAEFLKTKNIVIGSKFAAATQYGLLFVAPYIKKTMTKEFKEECRIYKIPSKIRGYLYEKSVSPVWLCGSIDISFA